MLINMTVVNKTYLSKLIGKLIRSQRAYCALQQTIGRS